MGCREWDFQYSLTKTLFTYFGKSKTKKYVGGAISWKYPGLFNICCRFVSFDSDWTCLLDFTGEIKQINVLYWSQLGKLHKTKQNQILISAFCLMGETLFAIAESASHGKLMGHLNNVWPATVRVLILLCSLSLETERAAHWGDWRSHYKKEQAAKKPCFSKF